MSPPAKGQSVILWLLLLLPLLDWCSTLVDPATFVSSKKYRPIESDVWIAKFPPYFKADQKPETLILGSSLPMSAFALNDSCFSKGDDTNSQILNTYVKAESFQNKLAEELQYKTKVENLSCAGCMVSDAYTLLKRLVEAGRTPQTVLYGVAPRDFADNMMPAIGESPLCLAVAEWSGKLSKPNPSATEYLDFFVSKYSNSYKTRNRFRNGFTEIAADNLGHPINLFAATHPETMGFELPASASEKKADLCPPAITKMPQDESKAAIDHDLELYKTRYNPVSKERLSAENKAFDQLIALCREHKITLAIVQMPLSDRNKSLIPTQLEQSFVQAMARVSQDDKVGVINFFKSDDFSDTDFSDSAHLNSAGSAKFQNLFVKALKQSSLVLLQPNK